jgi:hypothetical protein
VSLTGQDSLTSYIFGRKASAKLFCKTCGVHMVNAVIPESEGSGWSDEFRARHRDVMSKRMPVNLRVLADFETIRKDTADRVEKLTIGKTMGTEYVNP